MSRERFIYMPTSGTSTCAWKRGVQISVSTWVSCFSHCKLELEPRKQPVTAVESFDLKIDAACILD